MMNGLPLLAAESMPGMPAGIAAWTTTRLDGSFGLMSDDPVVAVTDRWTRLQEALEEHGIVRLATASQVHGATVATHSGGWHGWLRLRGVDGHISTVPGTALAVTVADCTPVFIAHPRGAIAALHAGWRGTAARILDVGLEALASLGFPAAECVVHLGPAICGACYEVGPEVLAAVYGPSISAVGDAKGQLDVRAVLRSQAEARGVAQISCSEGCTRCHPERYFSHRGGDAGRQLGVIALVSS